MVVVGLNGSKMTDYLRLNYYSNGDKGIFRESDAGLPLGYAAWLVQEPASKRTQPPQVFLRPVGGKRQGRAARMKASITNGCRNTKGHIPMRQSQSRKRNLNLSLSFPWSSKRSEEEKTQPKSVWQVSHLRLESPDGGFIDINSNNLAAVTSLLQSLSSPC